MKQDLTRHPELSRRNFLKAAGGVSASVLLSPLNSFSQPAAIAQGPALTDRVNLFLGSDSSAQCIPAAIRPFGMISPGPFNNPRSPCGYQMRKAELIGFNHTHLQGTGCGSYGVLVLLPTTGNKELGTIVQVPAAKQAAAPGYYRAISEEMGITAEMTATKRAAIHRYVFPASDSARILIDTSKGILWTGKGEISGGITPVGRTGLSGSVTTTAWREHTTYFHLEFSRKFTFTGMGEKGGYVAFTTRAGEPVLVKVGISYVSAANARMNLDAEIPAWDFENIRQDALAEWNRVLGGIEVSGGTHDQQVNFYTALYHTMFHPQLASDVNHEYRGMDGKARMTAGHNHYSVLSTWDTFRAAHPLYTLIAPDVQLDVIKTMLDDYKDSGWGPLWKLGYTETAIMPGTWADVIIADTYIKGITAFDTATAWELMQKNANVAGRRNNLKEYLSLGYVPYPAYINASRTLENAYCDFAINRFGAALGKKREAADYLLRAGNYRKLWDPKTGFFRGKDAQNNWSYPDSFDPLTYTGKGNNDYCEGNAWQWVWHVMQDTRGLIELLGGEAAFEAKLDAFLATQGGQHGTQRWGQYWHGNEPDQHVLYAYNYVGQPAKAAAKLRMCLDTEYRNDPWGMSGNEDAGQMSAWYVFTAMGFYPYVHAVPEYAIGSPIFDRVVLHLRGGDVVVEAKSNSAENKYVQSLTVNGRSWDKTYLPHAALTHGGTIRFVMGSEPSAWGTAPDSRPFSL